MAQTIDRHSIASSLKQLFRLERKVALALLVVLTGLLRRHKICIPTVPR